MTNNTSGTPRPPRLPHQPASPLNQTTSNRATPPVQGKSGMGKVAIIAGACLAFLLIIGVAFYFGLRAGKSTEADYRSSEDAAIPEQEVPITKVENTVKEMPEKEMREREEPKEASEVCAPAEEAPAERSAAAAPGWTRMFNAGYNKLEGNMVVSDQFFPIALTMTYDPATHRLTNIRYHNISQGVTTSMTQTGNLASETVTLSGRAGNEAFTIRFSYDTENHASGTATVGSRRAPVYLDF